MKLLLRAFAICVAICLSSCGGGGGGGGSDNGWLTISPNPVEVSLMEGTSSPIELRAHSTRTITQALYAKITDTAGVTTGSISLYTPSDYNYTAVMQVSPLLAPGTYNGSLQLSLYTDPNLLHPFENSTWSIPYRINVGARRSVHRILTDRQAVGFAAFPTTSLSRLSTSIKVIDNLGKSTAWTANSNESWLSVTASGTTGSGSQITLTATPSAVAHAGINVAVVTIASTDPSVANSETIRVAIWKGTTDPTTHSGGTLYRWTIADRAAPLTYAHNGGVIDILNAYTGATVGTLNPGTNVILAQMATSSDGSRLYALSENDNKIIVFDLVNRAKVAEWPMAGPNPRGQDMGIAYARPNGVEVLILADRTAFSATTGQLLRNDLFPGGGGSRFAVSKAGDLLYAVSRFDIRRFSLDYFDYAGVGLQVIPSLQRFVDNIYGEPFFALNENESELIVQYRRFATSDFMPRGELPAADRFGNFMSALTVGSDGRIYAGYAVCIKVFAADGTLQHDLNFDAPIYGATVTADGVLYAFAEYQYGAGGSLVSGPLRFEAFAP